MKTLSRYATVASLFFGLVGCQPSIQSSLDSLAEDSLTKRGLVGVGISVRLKDGSLFQSDAGSTAPANEAAGLYSVHDTRQIIGSVTKLYVATLAMQLVEEGQLSLDSTIERWAAVPAAERISVRMLLDHTSGLADCLAGMTPEERGRAWTPEQLIARAVARGAWAEPGDRYSRYSNTNFVILSRILEQLTGKTWTELLATRITAPLGLGKTASAATPDGRAGITPGWAHIDGRWVNTLDLQDPSTGWGSGGLAATNQELMEFTQAFFDGVLFKKPQTLAKMFDFAHEVDPATLGGMPPTNMGLAVHQFLIKDVTLEGHLGHRLGYDNAALRDPQTGAVIVVTTNTEVTGAGGLIAYDIANYLRAH